MSFKQFPIEFKGYHNGDGGLIYPNSNTMLNCRLNHHDAVEGIKGYANLIASGLSGVGEVVGLYDFTVLSTYSGISPLPPPGIVSSLIVAVKRAFSGIQTYCDFYRYTGGTLTWLYYYAPFYQEGSVQFSTFMNELVIIANGGNGIIAPNRPLFSSAPFTGLSALSTAPKSLYSTPHYNRLFLANLKDTTPSTLAWSDIDTIHTWPAANTLNVNTDDGDYITGIKSFKGDLYVFKSKSIYKIVGDNFNPVSGNYTVVKLEGIPGAVNQSGVCTANGNMYWVSKQYIVEYNGSSFKYIDYPYLTDDRSNISVSPDYPDAYILQHNEVEHEIIFMQRTTSTFWAWDYLQEQWSKHSISDTTLKISSMCEFVHPTTYQKNLVIGTDTGKTHMFGDYRTFLNSVGSAIAINSYYETDWMDMGSWLRKEAPKIFVDTKQDGFLSAHPYSLSCSVYFDYDPVAYSTKVFTCEGNTNQLHEFYPDVQTFRRIKLRFANNVLDTKMQVNRAVIEYDLIDESGRI